ncbi:hypothetical protein LG003_22425 [Photorhabdus kleinii]|uniref:hypothetical protein n=1 Tax=Photorhabdus kleinii TaxID=768034 RepID=UPI0021D49891|nr:hypothetical protein [Photorhabdus kleinii]MCT8345508.1 hypothetical protein [Photorhabdus kleinii]
MMQQYKSEAELLEALKAITPDMFADFLNEKLKSSITCAICHQTDIAIPQTEPIIVPEEGEDVEQSLPSFLVPIKINHVGMRPQVDPDNYHFRIVCINCGYEFFFSARVVTEWANKKQGEK